nr:immunoglobulin heavy chain junction region [Macaca mulatta]MOV87207.1 immunoglobulin heavy chain junction region [Macaca mulatta]MOV90489.1 immunoglobulin heavy chain junction region [Macaca mulatta]
CSRDSGVGATIDWFFDFW